MANASVLTASSSPRTRSAPMPTSTATRHATTAPISTVHGNAMRRQRPVEDARAAPADVDRQPADERGGGERAEAGERHLAERQLAGPPGEHDDRHRAEREARGSIVHVWCRSDWSDEQRQRPRATSERERRPTSCGSRRTHQMLAQPLGHRGDARRELEALAAGLRRARLTRATSTSTSEEQHELHEPGLGR